MRLPIGRPGDHGRARIQMERELAARVALVEAGLESCTFETCMEAAMHDVAWERNWPAGSYSATSGYCERHASGLRTEELILEGATSLYMEAPRRRERV
jgi:hypothetical protein